MAMRDLDVVTIGSVMAEISPTEHSVRVTEAESLVMVQAGSATTFSLAFVKLGGRLGLISRIGDDEIGHWIRGSLTAAGVDTTEIRTVPGQATPVSLASVDASGHKSFAYYRFPGFSQPLGTLRSEDIPDAYLQRAIILDLTESSLRSEESRAVALEITARARQLGCTICVNPNFRPTAWAGGADEAALILREAIALAELSIMNAEEALLLSEQARIEDAAEWLRTSGPELNVVTRGDLPVLVVRRQGISEVPALPVEVVFDIGAGDTFHAGFLVRYAEGADVLECVRFATQAAALKIQRPPLIAVLPARDEVEQALRAGA
jgi:sugar/nucleoside kinase (ribokinase family)